MNLQEIFDRGVRGILTQGKFAHNPDTGGCFYRTEDGCACALGHNIPDDKYKPTFEGTGPYFGAGKGADFQLAEILGAADDNDTDALREFQACHDKAAMRREGMSGFLGRARLFAVRHNLNTAVVDEFERPGVEL